MNRERMASMPALGTTEPTGMLTARQPEPLRPLCTMKVDPDRAARSLYRVKFGSGL